MIKYQCDWFNEEPKIFDYYNFNISLESPYANLEKLNINRDGILNIQNKINKNELDSQLILPDFFSNYCTDGHEFFYNVESNKFENNNPELVIVLHREINELPIEEILREIDGTILERHTHVKIFLLDTWGEKDNLLLGIIFHLKTRLNKAPSFIYLQEILWSTHLKKYDFFEPCIKWFWSDSYVKHLLLSKGARELGQKNYQNKRINKVELSPFHCIKFFKCDSDIRLT